MPGSDDGAALGGGGKEKNKADTSQQDENVYSLKRHPGRTPEASPSHAAGRIFDEVNLRRSIEKTDRGYECEKSDA